MSSKELLVEYTVLASKLENINETLLEMNSVEVAQLINTIRLVERKMGFVYTSFKSSVYSVVNQEQDQEQQNQSQDRIYVADDAQDHQGNQSQTPEHHQQAHRSFQLDNGEEEVSFLDPPQRPQAQTPYQTEQTQQTRDSQTPYQNLMMRSSLFRNSNRSRMSLSQFTNMQQQQQQQQQQEQEQQRPEQPTSFLQRLQQGNGRSEAGGERPAFAQSRGVGSKWSRDVDTNRPRYQ
ncbi:hypothetical protein BGZ59_009807 [Podila verticillata]|nr:hypothetical protein BGZ59_009807 [Podila verticillata]KAI9242161.1 MAG: DASH complex subunit Dad3-domain-containing protein [Podila humilis]